ncbi:MAG: YciI family protein [Acidobacteriota bacterium]|nr:YciI family protein [Acidobacteriota bacterium]
MKLIISLLLVGNLTPLFAQAKPAPAFKMVEFHMALLKRGPQWTDKKTPERRAVLTQHFAYFTSLIDSSRAVIGGPLTDEGEILGIYVLRAKSSSEAREWADADPAVKAGYFTVEMHPWWSEEVMKKAPSPMKMTTVYIGFLSRGAKWTPEKTAQTEELQKAHMANINRLAETKKLVVAGPFGVDGKLRGIFVFRVASLEEAKELAATDPSVQAGRLSIDMHPWRVPEGILP